MTAVWAPRHEDLLRACVVSPHVFAHLVDRLCDVVAPSQHGLETEASQRHVHRYLAGLLAHLERTNAEALAVLVDGERLVMQACIGTAPWDHRPLVTVLVGQVVDRLGAPDGVLAFDPRRYPKRGVHSVGVKRQWCGHRGKVDTCQGGVHGVHCPPRSCHARLPAIPSRGLGARPAEAPLPAYRGRGRRPKAPGQAVTAWRQSLDPDVWTRLTV